MGRLALRAQPVLIWEMPRVLAVSFRRSENRLEACSSFGEGLKCVGAFDCKVRRCWRWLAMACADGDLRLVFRFDRLLSLLCIVFVGGFVALVLFPSNPLSFSVNGRSPEAWRIVGQRGLLQRRFGQSRMRSLNLVCSQLFRKKQFDDQNRRHPVGNSVAFGHASTPRTSGYLPCAPNDMGFKQKQHKRHKHTNKRDSQQRESKRSNLDTSRRSPSAPAVINKHQHDRALASNTSNHFKSPQIPSNHQQNSKTKDHARSNESEHSDACGRS